MLSESDFTTGTNIQQEFSCVNAAKLVPILMHITVTETEDRIEFEFLAETKEVMHINSTCEYAYTCLLEIVSGLNLTTQSVGDVVLELSSQTNVIQRDTTFKAWAKVKIKTYSRFTLLSRSTKTYECDKSRD